jgi:hypothetical protein
MRDFYLKPMVSELEALQNRAADQFGIVAPREHRSEGIDEERNIVAFLEVVRGSARQIKGARGCGE